MEGKGKVMKKHTFLKSLLSSLMAVSVISTTVAPVFAEDAEAEPKEAVLEEAPAEAVEEIAAEEAELDSFAAEQTLGDVTVSAEAAAGVFPAGTEMTAEIVEDQDILDLAASAVGENAVTKVAVDITFVYEGQEIQPEGDVRVTITSPQIAEVENPVLVHVDDKQEELTAEVVSQVAEATAAEEVAADLDSFSVYAVIGDGETGEDARLTVNFVQTDGTTAILVKKSDDKVETVDGEQVNHFDTVLYDPGAGTLSGRQMFKGWTKDQNYTVDTVGLSIDDVRTEVKAKLNAGVAEGDSETYYAMIFDVYTLMLLDEDGAVLKSESVIVKNGTTEKRTVNEFYDPKDPDSKFEGWAVAHKNSDGKWVIDDNPNPVYPNGTEFTFGAGTTDTDRDLILKAYVPKGYWLIYRENGDGASFTPPQFYRGTATAAPTSPTRFGYTFGGWYTEPDCTNAFTFGSVLTATKTLYAKWNPVQTANYTAIIWLQNLAGDGYDYKEIVTVTGADVGSVADVTQQGTGNNAYARIHNTNKQYTGFHLKEFDQNVRVVPEGTAAVNVYYDRTAYTFTFRNGNTTIHTVTRLYDQDITDIWEFTGSDGRQYPRTDVNTSWTPQNSQTYTARITAMQRMPAENITWRHTTSNNTTRYFHYYVEVPEGETGTRTYGGRQFNLYKDLPNDFNIVYYNDDFWLLKGFTRLAITKSNDDVVNLNAGGNIQWSTLNNNYGGTNNHLYFYYTRDKYQINYLDGKYVDGDGVEIEETDRHQLGISPEIYYDQDISAYGNKDNSNYFAPEFSGYTFAGWYADKSCTQPYPFTKMPIDGVTVYAKWVLDQYRVFLYPNADGDDTFQSGGQSTSFRVDRGEEIKPIQMYRDEYTLSGWFTDPGFANSFNFDVFVADDNHVTTAYDQTEPTEKNEYGVPTDSINKDAQNNRFWITKKLELYAKWRYKLIGANGINVIYDAVSGKGKFADGNVEFTDPLVYQDAAEAVAETASVADSANEEFKYWVVQKWNGTGFEDTDIQVLPGDTFTIHAADAQRTENADHTEADPSYTYTIKLVAVYGSIEAPTPTHITWYSNIKDINGNAMALDSFGGTKNESVATEGWFVTDKPIEINKGYEIRSATTYTYPDYTFLGWAKLPTDDSASETTLKEEDLFLKWVPEADGKAAHFEAKNGNNWVTVTEVAADERHPYDDLYAVWYKPETFNIDYSSTRDIETYVYVPENASAEKIAIARQYAADKGYKFVEPGAKINLTEKVHANHFYGGYYKTVASTAKYEGGNKTFWKEADAWKLKGTEVDPSVLMNDATLTDKTYYLKEVPAEYLTPKTRYVYNTNNNNIVHKFFAITAIDDANYDNIEAVDLVAGGQRSAVTVHISNTYTVASSVSGKEQVFTAKDFVKKDGYVVVWNLKETKPTAGIAFQPYATNSSGVIKGLLGNQSIVQTLKLTTLDGVVVTRATRTVDTGKNEFATTADLTRTDENTGKPSYE